MRPSVDDDPDDPNFALHIGRREVVIRDRYETASIVNDTLIAVEFLVGSFWFFAQNQDPGIWLFVVGSAQLAIRPAIRLSRRVTLRRMATARAATAQSHEDDDDF